MKLNEYFSHLAILARKYPDAEVVYGSDDEGNSFQPVHYHPVLGTYDATGEFTTGDVSRKGKKPVHVVCIN